MKHIRLDFILLALLLAAGIMAAMNIIPIGSAAGTTDIDVANDTINTDGNFSDSVRSVIINGVPMKEVIWVNHTINPSDGNEPLLTSDQFLSINKGYIDYLVRISGKDGAKKTICERTSICDRYPTTLDAYLENLTGNVSSSPRSLSNTP